LNTPPVKSVWVDSKTKKLNVNIWPKQHQFINNDDVDEIFYGGAAGGGKSEAILHFCLKRRMENPGSRGIIFRRKFPDLERTLIPRSHQFFLPVGAKYNGSKHLWKFKNGAIQEFGFCENENDVFNYQSAEYQDMCFDEASHFTFFQFSYLTSRCRSAIAGLRSLIRLASNPGNVGHGWLKKRFIDPAKSHQKWYLEDEKKTLSFIPARLEDNPSLRKNDTTYEDRLKILGDKKYRALRFGDWEVFEGQFFSEFSVKEHVLSYNRVPDTASKKILCMDWGYASQACVLWLEITPGGRIFVYRELWVNRLAPKELAEAIINCSPSVDKERYSGLWSPPELWGKEIELEGGGQTIQTLMQAVFNRLRRDIVMQKANNARVPGWIKIREYLRPAPDGIPWLQIAPSCTNLIETLPDMIHDEKNPEDLDTDASDHAVDALRYGVVSLNTLAKVVTTPFGVLSQERIFEEQGRYEPVSRIEIGGRGGYGW
jgi:phage terminase large subunit